jgi:hypothetical protein
MPSESCLMRNPHSLTYGVIEALRSKLQRIFDSSGFYLDIHAAHSL